MTDWEPNKGAGEGEHEHYPIAAPDGNGADLGPLRSEQDYIAVQAVRWYVNDQDDFFTDRLATGTAYIGMAGEKYEVALGTYELEGGSRTAPIFDRSILPLRAYRGGDITINLALGGIEKANFVGGLLNEMAKASLDVVASAVSSASVVSPLASAGQTLVQGVKNLFVSGKRAKPIFNPQGFEFQLRSDELIFKEGEGRRTRGTRRWTATGRRCVGAPEILAFGQVQRPGTAVVQERARRSS